MHGPLAAPPRSAARDAHPQHDVAPPGGTRLRRSQRPPRRLPLGEESGHELIP